MTAKVACVQEAVERIGGSDIWVLILGENGTGKELVAKQIHELSARRRKPFVRVNSAAIPKDLVESELFGHEKGAFTGAVGSRRGKFELADGGTLFLDEIGDMPPEAQAKLLRALSAKEIVRVGGEAPVPIDVRMISASNKALTGRNNEGLRDDLYHRLSVARICIPPLRYRTEEIPAMVKEFIREFRPDCEVKVHSGVWEALERYDWPGNVRELRNVIDCALVMGGNEIRVDQLPEQIFAPATTSALAPGAPRVTLRELHYQYIMKVLGHTKGSKTQASAILGVNESTLYRRLEAYRKGGVGYDGDYFCDVVDDGRLSDRTRRVRGARMP